MVWFWLGFWLLLGASCNFGWAKSDFQVDGRVNLAFQARNRTQGSDLDKEGILTLKTPRKQGVRGVLDGRLSSDSGSVSLRELYVDYETPTEESRLIVGQAEKQFGLQWDLGMEDRLTLTRGAIYRKLAELSYAGRDAALILETGRAPGARWGHQVSLHTSDGLNAALLYSLQSRQDAEGRSYWSSYSLLHFQEVAGTWRAAGAQGFSWLRRAGPFRAEAEVILGEDFLETDYLERLGSRRIVWFGAGSLGFSWFPGGAPWDDPEGLAPFFRAAAVLHDLGSLSRQTWELTPGTRYFFARRFSLGGELQLLYSRSEPQQGIEASSAGRLALRYFF